MPTLEPPYPAQLASGSRTTPQRPRTVVIDALAARYGGAAYATLHMASELASDPDIPQVVLIARRGSLVAEGARPRPGLRLVTLRRARRLELARRVAWEAVRLPSLLREASPAVVVTWSGMLPRRSRSPVVCYLANPLVFAGGGLGNSLRRWAVRRTARGRARPRADRGHTACLGFEQRQAEALVFRRQQEHAGRLIRADELILREPRLTTISPSRLWRSISRVSSGALARSARGSPMSRSRGRGAGSADQAASSTSCRLWR